MRSRYKSTPSCSCSKICCVCSTQYPQVHPAKKAFSKHNSKCFLFFGILCFIFSTILPAIATHHGIFRHASTARLAVTRTRWIVDAGFTKPVSHCFHRPLTHKASAIENNAHIVNTSPLKSSTGIFPFIIAMNPNKNKTDISIPFFSRNCRNRLHSDKGVPHHS